MTFHPREGCIGDDPHHPLRLSRRGFLAAAAATGLAGVAGCSSSPAKGAAATTTSTAPLPLPRPNNPVTWPIYASNKAIANGLEPEKNATLKIYNWVAYVNQKDLDAFGKKYDCKVELTTFNTMTEAISKLRSGQFDFDVFVPTVDVLGPLVAGKIIQPLNHTYIPNISQAWTEFTNPFYDGNWNYTVPYTIYTTGMAWRKDHVPEDPSTLANPWAFPWQAKYKGKVAVLDDYRESMSLGLMKSGFFDLNTGDTTQLAAATNCPSRPGQVGQSPHRQQRLLQCSQRPDLDPLRLVGRHGGGRRLHAQGHTGRGHRLLVPERQQRTGGQRHHDGPGRREESGAGPPLPQLHAGPTQCSREHQLQRVHAAHQRSHPGHAGGREDPAPQPDLDRGGAVGLRQRPAGAGAGTGRRRRMATDWLRVSGGV